MTLQSLRNLSPGIRSLMRLPLSELALCPNCGCFYRATERFWCRHSEGMESYPGVCSTEECQDARGAG